MALLIPDGKCLMLHHQNFSLSSNQTLQAISRDQWRHLQLIQPHCTVIIALLHRNPIWDGNICPGKERIFPTSDFSSDSKETETSGQVLC